MREAQAISGGLPRPGKALLWAMGILLAIWLVFAVGINYAHVPIEAFLLFTGNTHEILRGEVWRLFTAGLVHLPTGNGSVGHIGTTLLGLYFLAPSLEASWGPRRMLSFLGVSMVFGFFAQFVVEAVLPGSLRSTIGQEHWFGFSGALAAVAVAWALSFRGQQVRLFFVLPVSSTGLLVFIVGIAVLSVFGVDKPLSGLVTPFGGMLAGWLFGAGDPTPARRAVLKVRYWWLAQRAARYRAAQPKLRVIAGGTGKSKKPPTDKRFLN